MAELNSKNNIFDIDLSKVSKPQFNYSVPSDNTLVNTPIYRGEVKREQRFVPRQTYISADNRTNWQKELGQKEATKAAKLEDLAKILEKGLNTLGALGTFYSPSTWVGPAIRMAVDSDYRNNGQDYSDRVLSGEGTGNAVGNLATDVITFGLPSITKSSGNYLWKRSNLWINNRIVSNAFNKEITEQGKQSLLNLNMLNELTYYGPHRVKAKNIKTLKDVSDSLGYGIYKSDTPVDNLSLKDIYRLANNETRTSGGTYFLHGTSGSDKLIHIDATGPQPVDKLGFMPKVNGYVKVDISKGEIPEIWWNRNLPYYQDELADHGRTIVTSQGALENLGIPLNGVKGIKSNVLHNSGRVPFNIVEFGLEPNEFGWYNRVKYLPGSQKVDIPEKTSLKFFERPSKLTLREQLGLSRGERFGNNLPRTELDAIRDFLDYYTSGRFRNTLIYDNHKLRWSRPSGKQSVQEELTKAGKPIHRYKYNNGVAATKADGQTNYTYGDDHEWADVRNMSESNHGRNIILTSPRVNFYLSYVPETPQEKLLKELKVRDLSPTVDKLIMKDFWSTSDEITRPGLYTSGDANKVLPLGADLMNAFDNSGRLGPVSKALLLGEIGGNTSRSGLSTDSYMSLLKLGNRPGNNLSFNVSNGFNKLNNSGVANKHIYDLWERAQNGEIPKETFLKEFYKWVEPFGGRPAYLNENGEIIFPHPFVFKKKKGGIL